MEIEERVKIDKLDCVTFSNISGNCYLKHSSNLKDDLRYVVSQFNNKGGKNIILMSHASTISINDLVNMIPKSDYSKLTDYLNNNSNYIIDIYENDIHQVCFSVFKGFNIQKVDLTKNNKEMYDKFQLYIDEYNYWNEVELPNPYEKVLSYNEMYR